MIYIAVCDDNEKLAKALRNKICQYVKENYEPVDITVYTQSTLLQYDIEDGKYFDLVLSDIEMPNIDGMNLVAYIKKHLPEVLIIFITSHLKYAIDAFELSIFRYIAFSIKRCIQYDKNAIRQILYDRNAKQS